MTITTAQLDGWYKRVYGPKLENVVPEFAVLRKRIPFKRAQKIGDSYRFPVKLTRSHGITWNGGATAGTAFALNSAISMVTKEANVTGSEFVLREQISYGAISRSGTGNDESFGPVMDEVPVDMAETANFYLEMALLYGGSSIATIESVSGSSTTRAWVITEASWAAGLWAQMENANIDVYSASGGLPNTKINTNAVVVVTSIDADNRTVNVSGNATDLTNILATHLIVPVGAVGNWFDGLDRIMVNTGSLFGISASTYNLWKANTFAAGSVQATMSVFQRAVTKAVVRGLMEKVSVLVSPYTWTDMNNDLAALRRFGQSTKSELDIGTEAITFYGANGEMEVIQHPMVKAGEAFVLPFQHMRRVGSSDVTFQLPDLPMGRFFRHLTDNAGVELRNYFDQGLISVRPARLVKVTGIDNASLS